MGVIAELLAQLADEYINTSIDRGPITACQQFKNEIARQDPWGMLDERRQELELTGRQKYPRPSLTRKLVGSEVKLPSRKVGDLAAWRRFGLWVLGKGTSKHAAHASQQFPLVEGLGDVVVRTEFEA